MILPAKFHVVSSLPSVPSTPIKNKMIKKNENKSGKNTVNLKSASFLVIMLLHEGLTHIHLQKKPKLHFGCEFHFNCHTTS